MSVATDVAGAGLAPAPAVARDLPADVDEVFGVRAGKNPLWSTPDMYDSESRHPAFAMHEVARCFFGRSVGWLRKHLNPVTTVSAGTVMNNLSRRWGLVQPLRTDAGAQVFRLYDIERLAHALYENGVLDEERFLSTISIVCRQIHLWGFWTYEHFDKPRPQDLVEMHVQLRREKRDFLLGVLAKLDRDERIAARMEEDEDSLQYLCEGMFEIGVVEEEAE
jgi:hypothetical protein